LDWAHISFWSESLSFLVLFRQAFAAQRKRKEKDSTAHFLMCDRLDFGAHRRPPAMAGSEQSFQP